MFFHCSFLYVRTLSSHRSAWFASKEFIASNTLIVFLFLLYYFSLSQTFSIHFFVEIIFSPWVKHTTKKIFGHFPNKKCLKEGVYLKQSRQSWYETSIKSNLFRHIKPNNLLVGSHSLISSCSWSIKLEHDLGVPQRIEIICKTNEEFLQLDGFVVFLLQL